MAVFIYVDVGWSSIGVNERLAVVVHIRLPGQRTFFSGPMPSWLVCALPLKTSGPLKLDGLGATIVLSHLPSLFFRANFFGGAWPPAPIQR